MKKTFFLGFALTALIASCTQSSKNQSIVGVYNMDKSVVKGDTSETVYLASEGNTQFKLYTPGEYFFIALSKDSAAGFGLGTYTFTDGKIEETNIYNTNTLDTVQDVSLEITKTENGYSQTISEMMVGGQKYNLKEDYTTIASSGTSALDGVWKQVKNLDIKGKDTVDMTYNEYKVFHAGHFMWGAKYLSDTTNNVFTTLVGHGTFSLNNDALTEDLTFSSRKDILGKYNIIVKFNGTDEYTQQTADSAANVIGFKTYKRIAKK
jgi:hypothetical protein